MARVFVASLFILLGTGGLARPADPAHDRLAALKAVFVVAHVDRLLAGQANPTATGPTSPLFIGGYAFEAMPRRAHFRQTLTPEFERKFSIDLQHSARRSMGSKAAAGRHNGFVALGYLNARDPMSSKRGTIVVDPERFDAVRLAWSLLLTGGHTVRAVAATLNGAWGYRTRATPRRPARAMGENTLYQAFRNPFYAGFVRHEGRMVRGLHAPMVRSTSSRGRRRSSRGARSRPRARRRIPSPG